MQFAFIFQLTQRPFSKVAKLLLSFIACLLLTQLAGLLLIATSYGWVAMQGKEALINELLQVFQSSYWKFIYIPLGTQIK
jgi:hypothetical protein